MIQRTFITCLFPLSSILVQIIPRNICYKNTLRKLISCQKLIPKSLLIYDTWFTSVSAITSLNKLVYYCHLQIDNNNIISTAIFGNNFQGGHLSFYGGLSLQPHGDCVHVQKFKHGQFLTDDFITIVHGSYPWTGA